MRISNGRDAFMKMDFSLVQDSIVAEPQDNQDNLTPRPPLMKTVLIQINAPSSASVRSLSLGRELIIFVALRCFEYSGNGYPQLIIMLVAYLVEFFSLVLSRIRLKFRLNRPRFVEWMKQQ